jgi:hypothetical protein
LRHESIEDTAPGPLTTWRVGDGRQGNLTGIGSGAVTGIAAAEDGDAAGGEATVKGDKVEIVIDAGDGSKTYEVTATRAGRRVEVVNRRGLVEVTELTRGGGAVRTARFMASRVLALVEHPAQRQAERAHPDGQPASRP